MDDEWSCDGSAFHMVGANMDTPSAELCFCRRDKHVVAFCQTRICPTRNAGDWVAEVSEVGRTVLADTVKRRDCYFELHMSVYNNNNNNKTSIAP